MRGKSLVWLSVLLLLFSSFAVRTVRSHPGGVIRGTVTDAYTITSDPVVMAVVTADNGTERWIGLTNDYGYYEIAVPADTYNVTVSLRNETHTYGPQTALNLVVGEGATVTQNFQLRTCVVYMSPRYTDPRDYSVGDTFLVEVNILDADDVVTWQIFLQYDTSAVIVTVGMQEGSNVTQGDFMAPACPACSDWFYNVRNDLSLTVFNECMCPPPDWFPEANCSGWLASVNFTVVSKCPTILDMISPYTYLETLDVVDIPFTLENGFFTIPGDVEGDDGDVDRYDFGDFGMAYGSKRLYPTWNPRCDIEGDDGDVDRYDFGDFGMNYGKSLGCP